MGKHKRGIVTQNGLQTQLDKNTGKGITNVIEEIEDKVLLAKFLQTERIYEVDEDGNVVYLGKETELLTQATITAVPPSNQTPELVQEVKLTVKTPLSIKDENITLLYAWNQNESESPDATKYTKALFTGSARTRNAIINSNDTIAGDYYLWAKVIIGEKEIVECFGPYSIKDHTTLVATTSETLSTSGFLGNTNLTRNTIESVTIATSFGGHSLSDSNCWDVSQSQDGRYLAWYEDIDNDGYPEVTIAGNGGVVANVDSRNLFRCIGYVVEGTVEIKGIENLDTGLVTNMSDMFSECKNITSLDLSSFNTSNVTNMQNMFSGCSGLTNLDVSNFDTSNVTNMGGMFNACRSLSNLDLSNFNTSNVNTMNSMFQACSSLTNIDVCKFDTSNVINMSAMFRSCSKLTSIDLSNFNTNNVTNMWYMFNECYKLVELNIKNFNMTNVTSYASMFQSVPTTVKITTNTDTANWIKEKFPAYESCLNII